jgi:hypothetical protein
VERRGDIRLQQAQFFTPATQQNVQRFSDSVGWILIHKISPCVNENVVTESRSNMTRQITGWHTVKVLV